MTDMSGDVGYIFMKSYQFVGMDQDSGGYPYLTKDPMSVKVWSTIKDALEYHSKFYKEGWVLYNFHYAVTEVEVIQEDFDAV